MNAMYIATFMFINWRDNVYIKKHLEQRSLELQGKLIERAHCVAPEDRFKDNIINEGFHPNKNVC